MGGGGFLKLWARQIFVLFAALYVTYEHSFTIFTRIKDGPPQNFNLWKNIFFSWLQFVSIERIVLLDYIHCLVSQKIEELKIYTKYHNTRIHKIHTKVNY
jgi:hypothetical protein